MKIKEMKKLLFFLVVMFLLSCEKEPIPKIVTDEFCWACNSENIIGGSYYSQTFDICSLTEIEIRIFEADNSYGVFINDYGPDVAARKITCVKQK
jgi:archaellum biogenesis protein FlaJ (TadC family)